MPKSGITGEQENLGIKSESPVSSKKQSDYEE